MKLRGVRATRLATVLEEREAVIPEGVPAEGQFPSQDDALPEDQWPSAPPICKECSMELESTLLRGMWASPVGWKFWLGWMMSLNLVGSLFYIRKYQEARLILFAFLTQVVIMVAIAETLGYVRLLGITHVVVWTPLMVYLFKRIPKGHDDQFYVAYLKTVFITDCLSLVIDYVDVGRYMLGERLPHVSF